MFGTVCEELKGPGPRFLVIFSAYRPRGACHESHQTDHHPGAQPWRSKASQVLYEGSTGSAVLNLPNKISRYHIIGRIATGGMAEILLAKVLGPGGFERPVVIKRVLPHLVAKSTFRDMFLDEARIVASIHHPNVVQVHELGREEDELYLVMEYLAGESVRSLYARAAARGTRVDLGVSAHIIAEACAGLHAAHEYTDPEGKPLDVVHRDVCPNNLLVTYDGAIKVVDFGIAQAADRHTLTEAGQVKGKAGYMSPEQCVRRPIDRRTDVFALGVVLYELTTGHKLFSGALEARILACLRHQQVQPPSQVVPNYPAELEQICMRALRLDPAERFATAEEMRRELVRFQRTRETDDLPEEQLKLQMRELFPDRIEEKTDLLSRLRAGTGITRIPSAEVADEYSVPVVETDPEDSDLNPGRDLADSVPGSATNPNATPTHHVRRARTPIALLMILALTAWGALLLVEDPGHDALIAAKSLASAKTGEPGTPPAADVPATVQVEQADSALAMEPEGEVPALAPPPEASAAMPAMPTEITVELTSKPAGASAWIGSAYHGDTPLSVVLPRQTEPVDLRLELEGHEVLQQTIVPDVDQRLTLSLSANPPPKQEARRETTKRPRWRRKAAAKRRAEVEPPAPKKKKEEFFLFE